MPLVAISRTWSFHTAGADQTTASWSGLDFDTTTHTIVPSSGSYIMALLDNRPSNSTMLAGTTIWFECAPDFTQTKWLYGGGTTVTTSTIPNSTECGWAPPAPPMTCDLVLAATPASDTITASVSGAHGAVTFSIDGGITRQASGYFSDLAPRTYVVTAYDAGAPNCSRSLTVAVRAVPPTLAPVAGALPPVAFAGNPIALLATATRPGRALLMELFIETAHGTAAYQSVVRRLRPTGPAGTTVLELQKQLAGQLQPERPQLARASGLRRLTRNIRRYYAALAEILPGTGAPGTFVFEAPRTVLLGGLSWPAARAGDFFSPLPTQYLTWRPNVVQEVGPDHYLLLCALLAPTLGMARASVQCFALGENQPFQTLTFSLPLGTSSVQMNDSESPGAPATSNSLNPATPFLVEFQLPVAELPAGTVRASVVLTDGLGLALTEARFFRIDASKRRRQFLFRNSLGQFDALSCAGPRASKTSAERTVATTLQPPDYDPQSGPRAVVDVTADERITLSTGAVSPAELHWLRELHTSPDVYEVVGTRLRKILLTTKELTNYVDDGGADGYSFEYQYSFDPLPYERYDWLPTA